MNGNVVIGENVLTFFPQKNSTHESLDFEYLYRKAMIGGEQIKKKREFENSKRRLKEYEDQFYSKIDKNQEDYKTLINSYRDVFTDPFKKHDDDYNPFDKDEEAEINFNIKKQEHENKINHLWLYEDETIDKLRKIKDKKNAKKYLEWQLLNKGLAPEKQEKLVDSFSSQHKKSIEVFFSENPEFMIESDNSIPGRSQNLSFGPSDFIEKYNGKGTKN